MKEAQLGPSNAAGVVQTTSSASKSAGGAKVPIPPPFSNRARKRQRHEMGTLGSGNHYLEVQEIAEFFDDDVARCR
jgi:RNA-splicing ligase RtcB